MTIDWHRGYSVAYEWWEVNPSTYRDVRRIAGCTSGTITRDSSDATLGTSSVQAGEMLGGERWVRTYLVARQGGASERICLGTHIAIGQDEEIRGRDSSYPFDMYTPLKELADDGPPDGFCAKRGESAVEAAMGAMRRFHVRIRDCSSDTPLPKQVTALNDSWLTFGKKVLAAVGMEPTVDEYGVVGFAPVRDAAALAPVWTFADDQASIIGGDATLSCGWADTPNTLKVVLSDTDGTVTRTAVNDSPDSPVSTVSRGRVVSVTEENPEGIGNAKQAEDYARRRLKELSCAERRIVFRHGYCPVRLGDCVRIRKEANGIDIKAKVVRQSIACETDLMVEAEAVYTEVAWNG